MILNIIGTIWVIFAQLCFWGFQMADPNFQPPWYQSLIVVIGCILTIIAIWI